MTKPKKLEQEYPIFYSNVIFRSFFSNNLNVLARMISDITGLKYSFLKNNISLEGEEPSITNNDENSKQCDYIVRYNNNRLINIELNSKTHLGKLAKAVSFAFYFLSSNALSGEEHGNNLIVIQIQVNYLGNGDKPLATCIIQEDENDVFNNNNLPFGTLNIRKCKELWPNRHKLEKKASKEVAWGSFLGCKELKDMPEKLNAVLSLKDTKIAMNKLEKILNDPVIMSEVEKENRERNTIYNDDVKDEISQNITQ